MDSIPEFLRTEVNGIELFTNARSGESGMSQTGLARACGVSRQTIIKVEATLVTKAPSKRLEAFVGKALTLVTNATKNGKAVKVYRSAFCAAVIKHYAKTHEKADEFDAAIGEIGLTSFIQSQTGWLPEQYKAAPAAHDRALRLFILDYPDPWERFYDKSFCEKVFRWFGAQFYWDFVYSALTPEEACKVNALNPPIAGMRADKIHQYLTPEAKTRLTPYIRDLTVGVAYSLTRQDFLAGYGELFNNCTQLRLKGI